MMLRSNCKKVKENIKRYILDGFDGAGYDMAPENNSPFETVALFIWNTFQDEKQYTIQQQNKYHMNTEDIFIDWCAGLPSVIDTCYYYNRSAVEDVRAIMEQTKEESSKYDETTAEHFLSHLIFREISAIYTKYSGYRDLYTRLKMLGYPEKNMYHHETDLYIYDTPLTRKAISDWCRDTGYNRELFVDSFIDNITKTPMFDIAFQYTPAWCK